MLAAGLLATRRFSDRLRPRLQAALAQAWNALADAHVAQAVAFADQLHGRLETLEAIERYLREVAVPYAMHDLVRARALAERAEGEGGSDEPVLALPLLWRTDVVDLVRRRVRWLEETQLACRLAASVAEERIGHVHVANAVRLAELLLDEHPMDEAVMHYLRAFELPAVPAQVVYQGAIASLAQRHALVPADAPAPREPARAAGRTEAALGLRMIG